MSITYRVEAMSCGHCAENVKGAIEALKSGVSATVNLDEGQVTVSGLDDDKQVETAVTTAGYRFVGRC